MCLAGGGASQFVREDVGTDRLSHRIRAGSVLWRLERFFDTDDARYVQFARGEGGLHTGGISVRTRFTKAKAYGLIWAESCFVLGADEPRESPAATDRITNRGQEDNPNVGLPTIHPSNFIARTDCDVGRANLLLNKNVMDLPGSCDGRH